MAALIVVLENFHSAAHFPIPFVIFLPAAFAGTASAGEQHRAAGRASSVWVVLFGLAGP